MSLDSEYQGGCSRLDAIELFVLISVSCYRCSGIVNAWKKTHTLWAVDDMSMAYIGLLGMLMAILLPWLCVL